METEMTTIRCPNREYSGLSATVVFTNGVGQTDDPHLIEWFRQRGYEIGDEAPPQVGIPPELMEMDEESLRQYAQAHEIPLGNATSQNGMLKKILAALNG